MTTPIHPNATAARVSSPEDVATRMTCVVMATLVMSILLAFVLPGASVLFMGILSALVALAFTDRKSPNWWVRVSSVILGVSTVTAVMAFLVSTRVIPAGGGSMISQNLCVIVLSGLTMLLGVIALAALAAIAFWTRGMLVDLVRNRQSRIAVRNSRP